MASFWCNDDFPGHASGNEFPRMSKESSSAPTRADSVGRSLRFIDEFLRRGSSKKLTGLVLAKLDAFNRIGSTFGEARTTRFCDQYAEELRSILPPKTPVIRLSERRFAILLALDSITTIIDVASRLAEEHPPQFKRRGHALFVDLTLGVAVYPTHADSADSLFRRAELALNEAAAKDLNFEIYRPDATQQQAALWKFSSDLERAVKTEGIEIYMQPKTRVADGAFIGAEVLVRWRHESGRLILPGEFVPLAERSGSIVPLTWLVFDKVAELVKGWAIFERELKIAVNVSARVIDHTDFGPRLDALTKALRGSGVGLILELTEESLISNYGSAPARLTKIRKAGVEIAIDDFGKGYSSLSYLKDIPATEIKIDKSFISNAPTDKKDQHIIRASRIWVAIWPRGSSSPGRCARSCCWSGRGVTRARLQTGCWLTWLTRRPRKPEPTVSFPRR
jgi:EAL domain-containing protein (putative c-di-GMP-specific phosphodiesterase class I)/GGDEF domain-containing protein